MTMSTIAERELCDSCWTEQTSADYEGGQCSNCGHELEAKAMSEELPEIVKRALVETVTDIGQLSKAEIYQLNKYVKKSWLSKGKGGPFPMLKTVYACPGYDFAGHRRRWVDYVMMLAELDRRAAEQRAGKE